MIIKATITCPAILDLSSQERLQEDNYVEKVPFRLIIRRGQTIEVDDKYYSLISIQSALKRGYIEILDYDQQNPFSQEVKIPESYTPNYSLTKVEILNRADYPQDAFEKYNANLDIIDANMSSGGSNAVWGLITGVISDQTDLQSALDAKANVSGQVFTGNVSSMGTLSGVIVTDGVLSVTNGVLSGATGDISMWSNNAGYITASSAANTYISAVTASLPLSSSGGLTPNITIDLSSKQDASNNLSSISGLTYASNAIVRMTAANTFALDTNTYLTSESDTLASVTGRGATTGIQLTSTLPSGNAPLVVASNTLVTNLNADLLDGLHANQIITVESDPLSIHLDQTSPQTFTGGTVTGSGLLNVTVGQLGLDTSTYLTTGSAASNYLNVSGAATGATSQAQTFTNGVNLTNLTSGRIPYVTTNGLLTDCSCLTYTAGGLMTIAGTATTDGLVATGSLTLNGIAATVLYPNASLVSITTGAGKPAPISTAGDGGAISLTSGAGGDGINGGSAGAVRIITGAGGTGSAGAAGGGGGLTITTGNAGACNVASSPTGTGGAIAITTGNGSTNTGGSGTVGGIFTIVTGNGGNGTIASGNGARFEVTTGNAGTGSNIGSSSQAGSAGRMLFTLGDGAAQACNVASTIVGSSGGTVQFVGGQGATITNTGAGSTTGGNATTFTFGKTTGNIYGGNAIGAGNVTGGQGQQYLFASSTNNGGGGSAQSTGGGLASGGRGGIFSVNSLGPSGVGGFSTSANTNTNTGGAGFLIQLNTGRGGDASGSTTSNVGGSCGNFTATMRTGGAATSTVGATATGGAGGTMFLGTTITIPGGGLNTGGGAANGTGVNTGGKGTDVLLAASNGGAASGGTANTGGAGGSVEIAAGTGGTASGTGAVNGANGHIYFYSNTTEIGRFDCTAGGVGNFRLPIDNQKILFGAAQDASLYFDNVNLVINPQEFGTGSTVFTAGNVGIGVASPTAYLHIKAGTATAGTAPIKLTSGTLTTAAVAGQIEFLTDKYYASITTGPARKELTLNDAALTSGRIPYVTTNGRLIDNAGITTDGTSITVTGSVTTGATGQSYLVKGLIVNSGNGNASTDALQVKGNTTDIITTDASGNKLGLYGATPVARATTGVASGTLVGGGGTTLTDTDTIDGYTLQQVVRALKLLGVLT